MTSKNGSNGHAPAAEMEHPITAPHSIKAEEALLGSVLINPKLFSEVSFLKPDMFFILRNGWVWEAMERVAARMDAIEELTLAEELRNQNRLEDLGGMAYIVYLASNVGTSVYAEQYARIVERTHIRREMLDAAKEIATLARDEDKDVMQAYGDATDKLNKVMPTRLLTVGMRSIQDAYSDFYDTVTSNNGLPHISTGFTAVDDLLGGFFDGDLYIVAGRPGMGKTTWLVNLAMNAAEAGKHVVVHSLEMRTQQVIARITAAKTGIDSGKFRRGGLTQRETDSLAEPLKSFEKLSLVIDDTPALSTAMLRASLSRLKAINRADIVFIDYLQLLKAPGENRLQQVSQIARDLKDIAKEIGIPVVVAAQLNRGVESREDKRPMLSDLRESGEIENNADSVILLYRDDYYNDDSEKPNEVEIIVAKSRNDSVGTRSLYFHKEQNRFGNLARVSGSLNPGGDL